MTGPERRAHRQPVQLASEGPESRGQKALRWLCLLLCSAGAIIAFFTAGALYTQQSLPVRHIDQPFYISTLAFCCVSGLVCLSWVAQLGHAPKPPRIVQPPTPAPPPKVLVKTEVKYTRMTPEQEETDVYRLFDATGRLLYVGVGSRAQDRWRDHAVKQWWPEVARHDTRRYPFRHQALAVEHAAIMYERPLYNISRGGLTDHASDVGWPRPRRVEGVLPAPRLPSPLEDVLADTGDAALPVEGDDSL